MKSELSKISRCKLCLGENHLVGNLRQSHIVPRFILQLSKDTKTGKSKLFNGKGKSRIGQFDWKEYMLCEACEAVMKCNEDFLYAVLFSRNTSVLSWSNKSHEVYVVSNDAIFIAFVTILWRASVSSRKEFDFIRIPDYILENFRRWILLRSLDENWESLITLRVIKLTFSNESKANFLHIPFVRDFKDLGYFQYVFIFGGFCCVFELPQSP